MALKNKSMYAISGILNLSPSTGYDIKKYSDKVLSGFWNENFSHIYPTLKMMLQDGMIEVVFKEENEKKVRYGITEKGKQELENGFSKRPCNSQYALNLCLNYCFPVASLGKM